MLDPRYAACGTGRGLRAASVFADIADRATSNSPHIP